MVKALAHGNLLLGERDGKGFVQLWEAKVLPTSGWAKSFCVMLVIPFP